jgi:hypothetical protein
MCGSSFQDLLLPIKLIDIDGDKLRLMFVFVHFTIFSVVCSLRNFHIIRGPTVILTTYISVARFGNDAVTTGVMNRIAETYHPRTKCLKSSFISITSDLL